MTVFLYIFLGMKKVDKNRIKQLYIDGATPTEIESIAGVSRGTVYNHKAADKKQGIDWDFFAST